MARALIYAGRPKEAVDFIKKGMRLDPHSPGSYLAWLGVAHFAMEQLEEAVSLSERALRHRPEDYHVLTLLAAAYAHLGRDQEARTAINSLLRPLPWLGGARFSVIGCVDSPSRIWRFPTVWLKALSRQDLHRPPGITGYRRKTS